VTPLILLFFQYGYGSGLQRMLLTGIPASFRFCKLMNFSNPEFLICVSLSASARSQLGSKSVLGR
jgi:hypothetical protein